jgi:hypothetical protein
MKKTIALIFFLLVAKTNFSQTVVKCDNEIYIQTLTSKFTNIPTYDKYRRIDSLTDGCYTHKIIKDSGDYFLVIPFSGFPGKQLSPIWLKKTPLICIDIRKLSGTITFYSTDSESKPVVSLNIEKVYRAKSVNAGELTVLNCKKEWYRVSLLLEGKKYEGWVKSKNLCANHCTTCEG